MPTEPAPKLLDRWLPEWQFDERHSIEIRASEAAIGEVLRSLTPGEIPLVRVLMWLRQPFARPSSRAPKPILEAAQSGLFVLLDDTPGELVMGLAGRFWTPSGVRVALSSPQAFTEFERLGFAKAAVNFRIEPIGDRFRLTTETRILTYGTAAQIKFGLYWWLAVRWGSGWIRMLWLRAIRRKAVGEPAA
ncbi:MAG: hypothetical protein ABI823_09815 [Bryobacteraceae bacterium]